MPGGRGSASFHPCGRGTARKRRSPSCPGSAVPPFRSKQPVGSTKAGGCKAAARVTMCVGAHLLCRAQHTLTSLVHGIELLHSAVCPVVQARGEGVARRKVRDVCLRPSAGYTAVLRAQRPKGVQSQVLSVQKRAASQVDCDSLDHVVGATLQVSGGGGLRVNISPARNETRPLAPHWGAHSQLG